MSDHRPTVFGIPSPWSGDENDRIPRTYWVWFRAHLISQRARHAMRLHNWRGGGRCDWCGIYDQERALRAIVKKLNAQEGVRR